LADKRLALEALGVEVVWHPERPLVITAHLPVTVATNGPGII
jgi:hypothetical protein